MIDRYLLRYFLAVVDQGTFSRAATSCNVSQPTLSVGIAKLERSLGSPLFFRSSQRVQLTEAGTRFLVHARRIEIEFNVAQQAITPSAATPLLRVGVLNSVAIQFVSSAIAATMASDPASAIELVYGTERELIGHLARGRVDVSLTLVNRSADRFLEQPLMTEGYALAMAERHVLAGRGEIMAEDLADNVMIVRRHCEALAETSRHFTDRGVRPRFALRSTSDEQVLHMVAAGLGITVMPSTHRHPGVVRPKLAGFSHERVLGLAFGHAMEHLRDDPHIFITSLKNAVGRTT